MSALLDLDARLAGEEAGWRHASFVAEYGPAEEPSCPRWCDSSKAAWVTGFRLGMEQFERRQGGAS